MKKIAELEKEEDGFGLLREIHISYIKGNRAIGEVKTYHLTKVKSTMKNSVGSV